MDGINHLFEISWEVCNKIGGIHTVIASKLRQVKSNFQNYAVIGPYRGEGQTEFLRRDIPQEYIQIFQELESIGIKIHYGLWDVNEKPQVFLIEYLGYASNINYIKGRIWDLGKVDSLGSDWYDFDEVMLWSWTAGILIEKLTQNVQGKVLVHGHEWMSGGAIFYIKNIQENNEFNQNKFKTIFTTHATMLGRALSGRGENLYQIEDKIDADQKAIEVGVKTKHQTEKALANISEVFTTVSQITADEAEHFYKKRADVLLYNGFDNPDLELIDNFYMLYEKSRERWDEFFKAYFGRYYDLNLGNTQVFFTSGRNEFRTKGIDIYVKALSDLNERLKQEQNSKEIIALTLIPIGNYNVDETLIESIEGKYEKSAWDFAPLSTHIVPMDNEYIQTFMKYNLRNQKDDKVKIILCPVYLDGKDGAINMSYYDAILGLDLGIFASFYEPWGYTPLECISYGVPTVTTNLAGFGRTILRDFNEFNIVKVLDREKYEDDEVAKDLANFMFDFTKKPTKELIVEKTRSKVFADEFSWKKFYNNYLSAYRKAMNR